jgi:hypothetical protein
MAFFLLVTRAGLTVGQPGKSGMAAFAQLLWAKCGPAFSIENGAKKPCFTVCLKRSEE